MGSTAGAAGSGSYKKALATPAHAEKIEQPKPARAFVSSNCMPSMPTYEQNEHKLKQVKKREILVQYLSNPIHAHEEYARGAARGERACGEDPSARPAWPRCRRRGVMVGLTKNGVGGALDWKQERTRGEIGGRGLELEHWPR